MRTATSLIFIFALNIVVTTVYASIKIDGTVLDAETRNPIEICHVKVTGQDIKRTMITNRDGQFNFIFEQDRLELSFEISCLGYNTLNKKLSLEKDTLLTILLIPTTISIPEVSVLSEKAQLNGLNEYYFTPIEAANIVSVTGEVDVMKQIQVLPGVSQGMDGTLGLFVRGGNNGNNRIEIDGIPIYGNAHLFGLTSIFQADVVQGVTFKMGGISAQNGNFLSSLTQVKTKNPLTSDPEYSFNASPYMLGAHAMVPLKNGKSGMLVGTRYSILNQEYKLVKNTLESTGDFKPQVVDGILKLSWHAGPSHTISALALATNDYLSYKNETEITQNWSNTLLKLEWDYALGQANKLRTKFYYNQFENIQEQKSYNSENELVNGLLISSRVNEMAFSTHFSKMYDRWEVKSGNDVQYTRFLPASQKIVVSSDKTENFNSDLHSFLVGTYLSGNCKIGEKIDCETGTHVYYYMTKDYRNTSADIRLKVNYLLSGNLGAEISYDHFSQFYQVLEGLPTGWSLDVMVPSYNKFLPARSNQLYSGLFWLVDQFHFNIGGYWKTLSNLVSYKNTENLFGVNDASWEDELESGQGESYGLEFMATVNGKRLNCNLGYTLSKTTRKYPTINRGNTYPFKFDREHILNIQAQLKTVEKQNKVQSFSSALSYSSGHKATLVAGQYLGITPPFWDQREGGVEISAQMNNQAYHRQLMSSKNGYSMPNYLRFDLGYSFKRIRKKYQREFTISIYNITNHKNPYLYFNDVDGWHQLSIFPIMPSFRYHVAF